MSAVSTVAAGLRRSAAGRVSLAVLAALTVAALLVPLVSPNDVSSIDLDNTLAAPALEGGHLFGTDELGRDQLVRTMRGMQVTLLVAVVASFVSLIIGVLYGALAGFVGGRVDAVMMRFVDTLYAMPFIFFVILVMVVFERNFLLMFVAIGAINWLDMARIVRGQTLSLRERSFVAAARLAGVPTRQILLRHIAPNLLGVVIVYLTLAIPQAILVESFLSYLGLGIQEPDTSLGSLVRNGTDYMETAPWVLLLPGSFLAIVLLAFNFLGDGLRDVVDSRRAP